MIGTRCIDIKDNSRKEKLSTTGENRRFTVRFFYPGIEDPGREPTVILTKEKIKEYGVEPELTAAYNKRVKVYHNLPMKEGCYPLILFSHGYTSCAESNTDLCMALAEHGYVIASISHPYEASETVFEDGTVVRLDKALVKKMMHPMIPALIDQLSLLKKKLTAAEALEAFNKHQNKFESFLIGRLPEWAEDGRCTIRRIHELAEDEDSFLYHRIDFSHGIGVTGHSFGGATAYFHCLYDDEVSCGVNIDGGLFGNFGETVNHKPFLQIINPLNFNVVTRSMFYHDKPVHFMTFRDMKHIGFCDVKFLSSKTKRTGTSDPCKTMDTLNEAHIAFFDRYLKEADTDNKKPLDISREMLESYIVY